MAPGSKSKRPTRPPGVPPEERLRPVERLVGSADERARARAAAAEAAAEAKRIGADRRLARVVRARAAPAPAAPAAPAPTAPAGPAPGGEEIVARYAVAPQRVLRGNDVVLLRDGREAYPAMLEAIASARERIDLETYIFEADDTGWRFAEALSQKAMSGVEVNVLYDGLGCYDTDVTLWAAMEWRGVRLVEYHPPAPWRSRWGLQRRDHRKILAVDGTVAFAGGLNIGDEYGPRMEGKPWTGWRDTHVRVRGPAVGRLDRFFERTWRAEGGARLRALQPERGAAAAAGAAGAVCLEVLGNSLTSRRAIRRAYLHAIRRARRTLWIANAYFLPDRTIRRELYRAAERGVDVRVMIPAQSDVEPIYYATRAMVGKLLRRGIRIFEWLPSMLHAKTAVVDGVWSTVGSYNIDSVSWLRNLEVNVAVYDAAFGAKMMQMYEQDLEQCGEILADAWRRRPFLTKVIERLWWTVRRWL